MKSVKYYKNQQGVVLIVSMLMLLIMTIIGVSASRTGALDTRIVANLKEERTVFQLAETGVELKLEELESSGLGDFETAYTATTSTHSTSIPTGSIDTSDTSVGIVIQSLGLGGYAMGSSIEEFQTSRFTIKSTAHRSGSNATATNSRGIDLLIPGS